MPTSDTGTASGRDQGGPPALEEDEDHEDDENEGFKKGLDDFFHAFADRLGGIQGNDVVQVRRKRFLGLLHELFHAIHRLDGVGARELVEGHDARRPCR